MNDTNTATAMTHKEMAAHVRHRIAVSKIPARVRMYTACGSSYIQVFVQKRWRHVLG